MAIKLPDHLANMTVEEFKKQKSLGQKLSKKQKQQFTSMMIWAVKNSPKKGKALLNRFGYILSPLTEKHLHDQLKGYNHPWFKQAAARQEESGRKILEDPAGAWEDFKKRRKSTKDNAR